MTDHREIAKETKRNDDSLRRLVLGPIGIYTNCRMCGGRFESRGLRFCPDCYEIRKAQPDFDDDKRWSSVAGRVTFKHKACLWCGGPIETHREGRKIRSTVIFCSDTHAAAYRRASPERRAEQAARIAENQG